MAEKKPDKKSILTDFQKVTQSAAATPTPPPTAATPPIYKTQNGTNALDRQQNTEANVANPGAAQKAENNFTQANPATPEPTPAAAAQSTSKNILKMSGDWKLADVRAYAKAGNRIYNMGGIYNADNIAGISALGDDLLKNITEIHDTQENLEKSTKFAKDHGAKNVNRVLISSMKDFEINQLYYGNKGANKGGNNSTKYIKPDIIENSITKLDNAGFKYDKASVTGAEKFIGTYESMSKFEAENTKRYEAHQEKASQRGWGYVNNTWGSNSPFAFAQQHAAAINFLAASDQANYMARINTIAAYQTPTAAQGKGKGKGKGKGEGEGTNEVDETRKVLGDTGAATDTKNNKPPQEPPKGV